MKTTKKVLAVLLASTLGLSVVSCKNEVKDEVKPEISGMIDEVVEAGKTVDLLDGVSAIDDVDGDITSNIELTILPSLPISNGSVTPTADHVGDYEVTYYVKDAAGNEDRKFTTLTVTPQLAEKVEYKKFDFNAIGDCPFNTFFFNDTPGLVEGTQKLNKGAYEINATKTDGEAWHIKYEGTIDTVSGANYEVTYNFESNVAGKVKFGANQEFDVVKGKNTVVGKFTASSDKTYTELQLGMLEPFNIKISKVTVKEEIGQDVFSNILPADFDYSKPNVVSGVFDNESTGEVKTTKDSAIMNITKGSLENGCWQTKLIIKTGLSLKAGTKYKISFDLTAEKAINAFEVLYNNGDVEKGIGALYNQKVEANSKSTLEYIVTPEGNKDDLNLVFQLGTQNVKGEGNKITVNNIKVEESKQKDEVITEGFKFTTESLQNDFWSDSKGTSKVNADGSVLLDVTQGTTTPNPWELKQYLWTGLNLAKNRDYKVSIDVTSTVTLEKIEMLLRQKDGGEANFAELKDIKLAANEKTTLTFETHLEDDLTNAGLVFQLGSMQQVGQIKFENLNIVAKGGSKEVKVTDYTFSPVGFGTFNDNANNAEGSLYAEDNHLVYEMNKIGLTDWHNKMYVNRITLEDSKIYTFKFKAKADKNISCAFFLNIVGKWDPRLSAQVDFTTEYQEFEFSTTKAFAATMDFELLWQFGSEANNKLGSAKITFEYLTIYSQDTSN